MGIWPRAVPAARADPEVLRNLRRLEALSDFLLIKMGLFWVISRWTEPNGFRRVVQSSINRCVVFHPVIPVGLHFLFGGNLRGRTRRIP